MKRFSHLSVSALLLALAACGGGGGSSSAPPPPPPATGLAYTDPNGTGWRLVKDASSTPTHLVLNLLGPSTGSGYGIGFTLSADQTKAAWAKVAAGDAESVQNVAYNLGTGSQYFKGKVQGGALIAGVFQKGVGGTATAYAGPLVRVSLDFVPGTLRGTSIPLSVSNCQELTTSGMGNITMSVGTLTAQ